MARYHLGCGNQRDGAHFDTGGVESVVMQFTERSNAVIVEYEPKDLVPSLDDL